MRIITVFITTERELSDFCTRASSSDVLACDTEFMREKTFFPRLCLIQLATRSDTAIVDPLAIKDLSALRDLFTNKRITKVFHAHSQDFEVIYDALDCIPKPLFDTQVAAAFLGKQYQIGYGALVELTCNVHLPKTESLTDWSRRPLDLAQIKYAQDDVLYLPEVFDAQKQALTDLGRMTWFQHEMQEACDARHFVKDPREAYLHVKRISSLTRKQLAIAREIAAWRDLLARRADVPRKWIVPDEILVDLAKTAPSSNAQLERVRSIENLNAQEKESLLKAIAKGKACPREDYPIARRHERPSAEVEGVLDLMYALLRLKCEKASIATQLIATREDLLKFLKGDSSCKLTSSWRFDMVGADLRRLLQGEMGLTVKEHRVELL